MQVEIPTEEQSPISTSNIKKRKKGEKSKKKYTYEIKSIQNK